MLRTLLSERLLGRFGLVMALTLLLGAGCNFDATHLRATHLYRSAPDSVEPFVPPSLDTALAPPDPVAADAAPAPVVAPVAAPVPNPAPRPAPRAGAPVVRSLAGERQAGPARAAAQPPETVFHVDIPSIGVSQPVYEGVEPEQLSWGPGHTPGTAMPGDNGNVVVAGHRTIYTHPFLDIDRISNGDHVVFTTPAGQYTYEVTGHTVVSPDDVWITAPTSDPTMTLYACHPKGSDSQRYVVFGRLLGAPPAPADASASAQQAPPAPSSPSPDQAPPAADPRCTLVCLNR